MNIESKYYPAILLSAFVIGTLIAVFFGFRPKHEGGQEGKRSEKPAIIMMYDAKLGFEL